jgi:hypothetical protein
MVDQSPTTLHPACKQLSGRHYPDEQLPPKEITLGKIEGNQTPPLTSRISSWKFPSLPRNRDPSPRIPPSASTAEESY